MTNTKAIPRTRFSTSATILLSPARPHKDRTIVRLASYVEFAEVNGAVENNQRMSMQSP
jgi:hypothetical protein